MSRAGLALAAAFAPAVAVAGPLLLGGAADPGGTIVGRVCVDRDGDGRCGPDEPGIAGATVFTAAGQVARADERGRFHLLEVPGRVLAGDRLAYGGQRLGVLGLAARALVDLAPGGAAQVDLAVPAPAGGAPPLARDVAPGPGPRRDGERLRWPLAGRTAPGAHVAAGEARTVAAGDGTFTLEVPLAPGDNPFVLRVSAPDGRAGTFRWTVHLAPRAAGGDLVVPDAPALVAAYGLVPGAGGALVYGTATPGARVRVGAVAAVAEPSGAFAAWVEGAADRLELAVEAGPGGEAAPALALEAPAARARGLEAVGLGEVEVAFGGDPGVLVSGRGTGSVRGVLGPLSVEAGLDLDDRDRKGADLLHPRDGLTHAYAPIPARTFLTAGDDAAVDDRNAPRGRLWARLRGPDLSLDLGTARAGLVAGELGRYDRAFFGARAEAARQVGPLRLEAGAFGATQRRDARGNAPARPARDTFAAHGGAFYWLSSGGIVAGSATVRAEWRDPFTGLLTAGRALARGVDYELDEASGRLALARPLPSVAPPAAVETGAPTLGAQATLIVEYLRPAAGAGAEDLSGGRAAVSSGPVVLEARAAREDRPGAAYRLEAAAATVGLGFAGLRAEVARSTGLPGGEAFARSWNGGHTVIGTPSDGEGEAVHLEGRLEAGAASLRGWWRERTAGYADGGFEEPEDARERGADLALRAGPWGGDLLWAERKGLALAQPTFIGVEDVRRLVARGRWTGERLELVGEVVDAERRGAWAGEETGAGARVIAQVAPRLALDLSHHQGLRATGSGVDPTFTAAGAKLELAGAAFQVRGGWGPELGARLTASGERARGGEAVYGTFGAEPLDPAAPAGGLSGADGSVAALGARRRAGGAEVFTEEQAGRDALGLRTGRVAGLALEPARGVRFAISGERGLRLTPAGELLDRDALAVSAGAALGPVRLGARGELRDEGDGRLAAAGASLEWRATPRLTLSARGSFSDGDLGGVEARLLELSAGGALRLARGALLGTVTRLEERRPRALEREGVLARLAATAEVGSRLSLGAAAGLALQEVAGAEDDRISGSVRAAVRIAGPVDVGAEAARRGPLGDADVGARTALRAELGVRLGAPARGAAGRIALGYHLVGFSGDGLAPEEETGRLFLRAQLAY